MPACRIKLHVVNCAHELKCILGCHTESTRPRCNSLVRSLNLLDIDACMYIILFTRISYLLTSVCHRRRMCSSFSENRGPTPVNSIFAALIEAIRVPQGQHTTASTLQL